ncbi:MAG: glycosyltransferase family 4 protein [Candidatus Omnitrophota bacterium]|nr:glycosyltransferase family 4 protein [Candidatus Omnitrophota bacterium]
MRILQLTTHLNIGGIGIYVTNLSKALKDRGHTVFIASSGGNLEDRIAGYDIPHFKLDINTKSELNPKVFKSSIALKKIIKDEKIDLIHAHTRVTAVSAAVASYTAGISYVTTCHGFFKRRLGRLLCGCWGDKVVAISEAVKQHLRNDFKIPEDKIALIYTGVETARLSKGPTEEEKTAARRKFGLENAAVIIGAIGRLSPVKGQEVLLRAANSILKGFPEARILLVGDGPDEQHLKGLVSELGIEKNVVFAGSVNDTKEALSIMDVFVLPSIKEGLGLSLIEAMACGRPCVASRIGGVENVIEEGKTGLFFTSGDSEELAAAVKRILTDGVLRDILSKNGREKALKYFDIGKMTTKMEMLYKEVIYAKK